MVGHLEFITAWETGELNDNTDAIAAGFQAMIDDGTVWGLQGTYGRTAADLIEAGLCRPA